MDEPDYCAPRVGPRLTRQKATAWTSSPVRRRAKLRNAPEIALACGLLAGSVPFAPDPTTAQRRPAADQMWPATLWIVRHGQSAGNVARDAAEAAGLAQIEIAHRDVDVPLSALGERQALALGRWFASMPAAERPTVVLASPYLRAVQTSKLVIETARLGCESLAYVLDERLREKEFGLFNRLTRGGIVTRYPEEAERREEMGKFYYRPPAGESWCDVILRLRSVLDELQLQYHGERVLIVAHQVIVLCFRYLLEKLDEHRILAIDSEKDVANCGVTSYAFSHDAAGRGQLALTGYNFVSPLEEAGTPVTQAPDAPAPMPVPER